MEPRHPAGLLATAGLPPARGHAGMKGFWGEAQPQAPLASAGPRPQVAHGGGWGWCRPFSTHPSGGFGVGAHRGGPFFLISLPRALQHPPGSPAPQVPPPPHRLPQIWGQTAHQPLSLGYQRAGATSRHPPAPQVTSGSPPPRWGHPRVPVAAGSWHSARVAPGLRQAPAAVPFHVSWQGRERSRWRHRHTASRHASVPPPAPRTPKIPTPGSPRAVGEAIASWFWGAASWAVPRAPTLPTQPLPLLGTSLGAGCLS